MCGLSQKKTQNLVKPVSSNPVLTWHDKHCCPITLLPRHPGTIQTWVTLTRCYRVQSWNYRDTHTRLSSYEWGRVNEQEVVSSVLTWLNPLRQRQWWATSASSPVFVWTKRGLTWAGHIRSQCRHVQWDQVQIPSGYEPCFVCSPQKVPFPELWSCSDMSHEGWKQHVVFICFRAFKTTLTPLYNNKDKGSDVTEDLKRADSSLKHLYWTKEVGACERWTN